jgi:tetratricopeptide (TPR) repeat protein
LGDYFFDKGIHDISLERYQEAVAIFEWDISNAQRAEAKQEILAGCYARLLDLEDEGAGPITEARAELCYKLANCYVQVNKLEGKAPNICVYFKLLCQLNKILLHDHEQDAVLMYREAIMIQSQLYGSEHLSVANSLHNLGNCYRDLSDFEKSFDCLSRSLSLLRLFFEDENEEIADTCHCLALTLARKCELDEASSLFERALTIRKKKLGAMDLNVASSTYNLAVIHQMRGAWSIAMKHCKDALRIQKMTVGDDNAITASTIECIGRIHMDKREFEDSIQCFRNCISQDKPMLQLECGVIYRSRGESFKARKMFINAGLYAAQQLGLSVSQSNDLDILQLTAKLQERKADTSERNLLSYGENAMFYGSVLMNIDKFREALECFRFSNVIFQAKFGCDHLTIAKNLHYTGFILEKTSSSTNSRRSLEEALELLTEALRIRKLHLVESHPDLEETLLCLGRAHQKLGNFGDALHFLTDAVKARDDRLGSMHARMDDADTLIQVGQLQQQSGKFREALDSFEQCLNIRRRILGREHPSIGELLFYIGNLLREVGDLDSAQLKFEQSLAIAEQTDPDSIETADILFSLGVLYTEQKQFSVAIDAYLGSLQIHKAKGSTKIAIAEILNNIGIAFFEMNEFDKAQVYHSEALESLRQELGDDHADVAFCWHSLGAVYQELSDQEEALKCFQHAVLIDRTEMYLQSLGICLVKMNENENAFVCLDEALRMKAMECDNDADDDLAEIQRNLGIVWMREKKFDKALKCFEDALTIKIPHCSDSVKDHSHLMNCLDGALEAVSELYGTRHMKYARLLHKMGDLHSAKNEHSLAIGAYVEVLRIYKGEHGDSHLSVANTLFNLGVSLNAKGSPDKAIRCFMKALHISKEKLGEDHLDVADSYEQIAESNKLLLRYDDAKSYYEKSLFVRKQATGGGDVKSAVVMQELGQLHLLGGLLDDAERAFKEAVRIRTMQLGEDHLVAESMYNLGLVYISRNDNVKALKYLEGSLRVSKSKLANADTHLANTFHSLGGVHSSMGDFDKSIFCYDKAIQIYIEVYGKYHDRVASSLSGKGESLRSGGHHRKALACFSECLDIRKSIDGPTPSKESGDVLSQMGDLYSQVGDDANASSSFASALSTYRQIFGTKHQTVANVLQKMADQFVKVNELERGYSCVKEALALRQVLLGEDDVKTGDSHYCKGIVLFMWHDYAEASQCFESARDIHKQLGPRNIHVANSNFYLGCISGKLFPSVRAINHCTCY